MTSPPSCVGGLDQVHARFGGNFTGNALSPFRRPVLLDEQDVSGELSTLVNGRKFAAPPINPSMEVDRRYREGS